MANTTSGPVNGKAHGDQTGENLPVLLQRAATPSPIKSLSESAPVPQDKIDVFGLYKYYSPTTGGFQADARIAEISSKVGYALDSLKSALKEDDELQRENHIAVAVGRLFALATMVGEYDRFDEAISAILTAVEAHKESVYSRAEIVAIQGALEILKRSPNPGDSDLTLLCETLENAGFDLNAPMTEVEIGTEEEADF